ncbi:flagellar biosynthesis anti-sigma factor FlgM [Maridesulfovibrio sp.]|jgi:hypothetical protein|uniref:flagellar biosynthesis anti-sigma factor FlgM n=1 Tax=Maridesulfovibrio sp. TaxID=2795000 RepID=UPI0029C9DE24|nr:flagellar biosynthesis anti-sigma factor FlgM [Maridesulfovibrio sp.]
MTFDKNDKDGFRPSYKLSSDGYETSLDEENPPERQEELRKLREQIRTGTYRPAIGEIAINLVRSDAKIRGFN